VQDSELRRSGAGSDREGGGEREGTKLREGLQGSNFITSFGELVSVSVTGDHESSATSGNECWGEGTLEDFTKGKKAKGSW